MAAKSHLPTETVRYVVTMRGLPYGAYKTLPAAMQAVAFESPSHDPQITRIVTSGEYQSRQVVYPRLGDIYSR